MNYGYYGTRSFPMAEAIHYVRQLHVEVEHWVGRIETAIGEASLDTQAYISDTLRRAARDIGGFEQVLWAESERMVAAEDEELG